MPQVPKAVLYYSDASVWCAAALLALEEKGYGEDEVDLKLVDLSKGENYSPSFLRLNPQATVPTLVVPLAKTLSSEVESRFKAITGTAAIVDFLDKSRSATSKTHTTSSAPAPSLAPATIAFSSASKRIVEELHSDKADPNALTFAARDASQLTALSTQWGPMVKARDAALTGYLSEAAADTIQASAKTKTFWKEKQESNATLLGVLASGGSSTASEKFYESSKERWDSLKEVLAALNKEMIGPYALGDQISIADVHVAAWLARIMFLAGGLASDDGKTISAKLEAHIGGGYSLPKDAQQTEGLNQTPVKAANKLEPFWNAFKERESWKKVYADGLH